MESREDQIARETRRIRDFQSDADDLARAIVCTDLPWVDVAIRIEALRAKAERQFPGKGEVFDRIYVRRFERLREDFRRG